MDRNRGVILLDWLAESTEDPDAIKEALQANQSRIDLETRMLGLSSLDGGRFERDVMATEAHLMNIVHYGEVNTYRALIAQVERGEIN